MRKAQWGLAALIVTLAVTAEAQVPGPKKLPDLKTSVANSSRLKVATVERLEGGKTQYRDCIVPKDWHPNEPQYEVVQQSPPDPTLAPLVSKMELPE